MGRNGSLREMQSGISSHQSTRPNGMRYLLTKNRILSGLRSLRNSPLAFPPPMAIPRRTLPSRLLSLSTKHRLFPLFRPSLRRRLTSSPNTSTPRILRPTKLTGPQTYKPTNLMHKHPRRRLTCPMF